MERTWIVVCDASRARFFMTRGNGGEWVKFEEIEHPASRMKSIGLVSDRPGRQLQSQGSHKKAAMEPRTNPHDVEEMRFAHSIAETLDLARAHDAFERLVIVAPPAFLGRLRQAISDRVRKAIYATLDKDYTHLDEDELHERVAIP
ncbi:MAG TPA: host attachment protein [Myxococcaceae bacterium]|jgi:protein required for attachment to host cells|nr:host attachment protein [Myxococcaceae bacterium]